MVVVRANHRSKTSSHLEDIKSYVEGPRFTITSTSNSACHKRSETEDFDKIAAEVEADCQGRVLASKYYGQVTALSELVPRLRHLYHKRNNLSLFTEYRFSAWYLFQDSLCR